MADKTAAGARGEHLECVDDGCQRIAQIKRLSNACCWVVIIGAIFTLVRFSEAFLLLRAQQGGPTLAWVPLVPVAMNLVYALSAYPIGTLSDRMSHRKLLAIGLVVLIAADFALAFSNSWHAAFFGVRLIAARAAQPPEQPLV